MVAREANFNMNAKGGQGRLKRVWMLFGLKLDMGGMNTIRGDLPRSKM